MSEHNHQAVDGPDYEGCPACIEHDDERAVRAAAAEIYKPEGVEIWMNAMQARFDGRTPLEAIADGDTDRVLQVLDQLASGAFG